MTRVSRTVMPVVLLACATVHSSAFTRAGSSPVRLVGISSRVDTKTTSVVIEVSEPVAYVTSRPDPLTVLVDLRDVRTMGAANKFEANRGPVAGVAVEQTESGDGDVVARIRVLLSAAVPHRVRSSRNTIRVDFESAPASTGRASPSASRRPAADTAASSVQTSPAQPTAVVLLDPMAALRMVQQPVPTPVELPAKAAPAPPPTPVPPPSPTESQPPPAVPAPAPSTESQTPAAAVVLQEPALVPPTSDDVPKVETILAATLPGAVPTAGAPVAQAQPAETPVAAQPAAQAQPAAGAQIPTAQTTPSQAEKQYTGQPVSLDFQGVDLRAVLRTFAEISGLNIVIDPAVQGVVDVALRDVPWDQALDIILRSNKLGYTVDGTVVRIAPLGVLAEEEAQRRKLAEEQALSGERYVLTRTLSYARAADLQALLLKTVLSNRGEVQIDARTNTLIIRDLQDRLDAATGLIGTLDRPEPQVEIEARIVQTGRDFARSLGVQWGITGRVAPELGNTTPLAFPNRGSITGRAGADGQGTVMPIPDPRAGAFESTATAVNLPASPASSAIGLTMGAVNGALNLDLALSALEESGKGRILSTPRVSTQNNSEAEITQGIQIPIQTVANNTVTVTFKDAALTLKVTPQITSANTVIMRIGLENAIADWGKSVNGIPPINTQRANTLVQVSDGATTVIGGIFMTSEQSSNDRTPGLSRIPLLGWLFRRETINDESSELLIFITPRIIKE